MGRAIHEIGHAVGFWHEQSREDRDLFVTIHWDKSSREGANFNQHIADGDDVGTYDYGSIMHYRARRVLDRRQRHDHPDQPGHGGIGQRIGLSAGDIASANAICPRIKRVIDDVKTNPDDIHTRKEVLKEARFDTRKELILDTRKELVNDTIKEGAFDPVGTWVETIDPLQPGRVDPARPADGGPGGRRRWPAVRDADLAPGARRRGRAWPCNPRSVSLDAQLAALAEQIAQTEAARQQLQAQYEETAGLLGQAMEAHDEAADG